jgi:hypothetical protein
MTGILEMLHYVNTLLRLPQLDILFDDLLLKQQNWPPPIERTGPDLYADFYHTTHSLAKNIVCASCAVIRHDVAAFQTIPVDDAILQSLKIDDGVYVPYDFSSGFHQIDQHHIMIEKEGLSGDGYLTLCNSCHSDLQSGNRPDDSLSNFRWVGIVPEELAGLTWVEELLIARAHLVGRIVRLQQRSAASYLALKGHTVLLPQDTTRLLDLLPMPLSSLPDVVRVVWTGKTAPDKARLRPYFTVRREKVYNALKWLCAHHEDYRHVTIDEERISIAEATVVATDLLDSIAYMADASAEYASRSGFATEDPDVESFQGDIPFDISGIIDMNNITEPAEVLTLTSLAETQLEARNQVLLPQPSKTTVNVVTGCSILNDHRDSTCFTSAFPTIFPYGTGKHIDSRRRKELDFTTWVQLLLRHSSR